MEVGSEAAEVRLELGTAAVELAVAREAPTTTGTAVTLPVGRGMSWALSCLGTDVLMLVASGILSSVAASHAGVAPLSLPWKIAMGAAVVLLMARRGLYVAGSSIRTLDDAAGMLVAVAAATVGALALVALAPGLGAPAEILRFGAFAAVYVTAGRLSFYRAHLRSRREGEGLRPTLVIGAGRVGQLVSRRLLQAPELGMLPVGFLDKDPPSDADLPVPVLGASWDLERVIEQRGIEQIVVCFSTAPSDVVLRLVERCHALGVGVAVVPRLFEKTTSQVEIDHVGGVPLVHARPADPASLGFLLKYAVDRVVAALALIVLAPLMLVTAAAVWRSLGRPILFRQVRVGRDGRCFRILKFRSMRPGPADVPEAERLTRVGAFIRRTSIDELPQLINVLRGDMSLVGPRPERPELVSSFEQTVHRYGERHRVKSGITGWAQVHGLGRGDDRFGDVSMRDRAEWDNFYIENWSFWLDVKIAVMTVLAVLRFRQA